MDFFEYRDEHVKMFDKFDKTAAQLELIAAEIVSGLKKGNKLLICGNGGSASDAQHFAAEIIGRFEIDSRPALPAIALNTDTSVLTAIGNDFGFEFIFSRQVNALCQQGDIVICFSTSGKSRNVIAACDAAIAKGGKAIIFTGELSARTEMQTVLQLNAPSSKTARIQEYHIFCIHCICAIIDKELCSD